MTDEDKAVLKRLVIDYAERCFDRAFYTSEHVMHYTKRDGLMDEYHEMCDLYERVFGEEMP